MKPVTVEDYQEVADEFFDKYDFVYSRLSKIMSPKPEDVLKVMESLTGLVMKKRGDEKAGSIGFTKTEDDDDN